ncbi:MAG: glycosyltransferase [Bacteroidota bacterium]
MGLKRRVKDFLKRRREIVDGLRIINLYDTDFKFNVCISYLTGPFIQPNHFKHQNFVTSHIVAETFRDLGYNVDVYDYQASMDIQYDTYNVIFGIGDNFERSFYSADRSIPRIHLITGTHQELHNTNGLQSVKDFYELSGVWLSDETNIMTENHYYAMYEADLGLIMAEGFVFENCKSIFKNKLYTLNNNILGTFSRFANKSRRTRNFLFLSGGKQITKGLSLVLELARNRVDINFYIVVPRLNSVLEEYYADVFKQGNVYLHKDLRMDSPEMKEIIEECSYVLTPSYVDGLPGGTIEPMSAGLLPLVSKYCGFGVAEFIFQFEEMSVGSISEAVDQVLSFDDETYFNLSHSTKEYAIKNFGKTNVKRQLKSILKTELPRRI